jgi:hypothetical protein
MNCIPGLNVYDLLTVDLLHEVELGVWKGMFTHIIRILSAWSPTAVGELDRRYAPWPDLIHTHDRGVDFASSHHLERAPSAGLQAMHRK